jgi:hypothetical protein
LSRVARAQGRRPYQETFSMRKNMQVSVAAILGAENQPTFVGQTPTYTVTEVDTGSYRSVILYFTLAAVQSCNQGSLSTAFSYDGGAIGTAAITASQQFNFGSTSSSRIQVDGPHMYLVLSGCSTVHVTVVGTN